jgi:hypothetical protein
VNWTRSGVLKAGLLALCAACAGTWLAAGGCRPREAGKRRLWTIGIYEGASPLALSPAGGVTNPVMAPWMIGPVPPCNVADPFMIRRGSTWYLFMEVIAAQGNIGYATSPDGLHWTWGGFALIEPFHTSYPYVFEWEGELYMIPETKRAGEVRLYRADRFPDRWHVEAVLARGALKDASIFRHGGRWWLFACDDDTRLHLFYAEKLTAPWVEHPRSPVVRDKRVARPGGRVVEWDGKLLRFAQEGVPRYGTRVWAFEITRLTTSEYAEKPAGGGPVVEGSGTGWNAFRMHTVDAHQVGTNHWLACVDGDGEVPDAIP